MVKYIFFILIALLIDGLQFFLDLAFTAIGAVSGTLGGAAAGAYVCSPAGATVQSLCAAAGGFLGTFTNPALAAIMVPLCAFLGFVIGVVISLTIGSGLIFLLAYNGMYYPKPMGIGFITEIMPGFDMLPGWTTMVVICVFKDAGLSAQGVLGFAGSVGSVMQQKAGNAQQEEGKAGSEGTIGTPQRTSRLQNNTQQTQNTGRAPLALRKTAADGISPNRSASNDNSPRSAKLAA
jgi:hypothetical protein